MVLYSKVVTIRDSQLNEKKVIQKEKLEEERRLDTGMEVERLKALKMYEERETRRKEDQRVGAQVIINQMKERERERVRQLELQDQEREAMLKQNEDLKNEELRQQQIKKEAGKKLLEEVAMSNADQIMLKKREKEKGKDEDRRIAAYLRDREIREQDLQQEKEEFDRILRVQREAEELEHQAKVKKSTAATAHMEELQAQILMNAEVRKKNRMDFLEEGVGQRAKMEGDRLKLEAIKSEKLSTLQRIGVPEKYTVDLASKKFS